METTTHIDTLDTRVAAIMYKVLSQQRETAEQRSSQYQPLSLKLNVGQDLEVKKGKFRAASLAGILASSEFFDLEATPQAIPIQSSTRFRVGKSWSSRGP
ncbi:hypothetical protein H2248_002706 [Termitomyces sp. 'cryptogamus']|nr:hypothetical protein H2248_002706 [Termitomyces sp. 'cryptogamus']